jgi:mannose-6-phosphate isomerase
MIDGPVKPPSLYPLRLEPFCQYRPWADGRLADLLSRPIPAADRMGEAWLLSDRDDHASIVADGPLAGTSLGELRARCPEELFGDLRGRFARFPLLLKFLDVKTSLSVQVHPADADEKLIPTGNTGKTEAWIVMTAGVRARIFAGWNAPVSEGSLREAIADGTVADRLASFAPRPGDAILTGATLIRPRRYRAPCRSTRPWHASTSVKARSSQSYPEWRRDGRCCARCWLSADNSA